VIRRILRRAVRYGYSYLNFKEPFLFELIPLLCKQFEGVFPELISQEAFVAKVIQEEETAFLRTLSTGLIRLDKLIDEAKQKGLTELIGEEVFELNDTFGFPVDLTALIAKEKGMGIDEKGFEKALHEQKNRSRKDATTSSTDWVIIADDNSVEFLGYEENQTQTQVLKYQKVENKSGKQFKIVLASTPFYAESGGQVGDSGTLTFQPSGITVKVIDTKKENDLIIHIISDPNFEPVVEESVIAKIDISRRNAITKNHSSTHLMQAALQQVLGNHVAQKGSLVNEEILRFDFSHFQKVGEDEIKKIEEIVNQKIEEKIPLIEERNIPIEEAKKKGAMALFGEKYGDFVRVITFDKDFSVELCGGTHVKNTSEIGLFKIISEGSVATGVRRIEAITAKKAYELLNEQENLIKQLNELLKSPKDLEKAVKNLIEENSTNSKLVQKYQEKEVKGLEKEILKKIETKGEINLIKSIVEVPNADSLKNLCFDLQQKSENLVCILAAEIAGKASLAISISKNLVETKGLNAGQIIREIAKEIQGGGGGQPFLATAGGNQPENLTLAINKIDNYLK
ncbi:MAG: Alanine--tRNA ligase, partial [Bacteroidota bacterium]